MAKKETAEQFDLEMERQRASLPAPFGERVPDWADMEAVAHLLEAHGTALSADTLQKLDGVVSTWAKSFRSTDNDE